jgi:hypothetical protein
MSIEAMKQALEALALFASDESDEGQIAIAAHEALRQAIEQADQFPDTTKMMPTGKDSLQVEAMKQALEALGNTDTHPISSAEQYFKETQAMKALEDAIKDVEEQKPICKNDLQVEICKREWDYLTNDDIDTIVLPDSDRLFMRDLARIIEAKIKAKNT